jgi:hypothetical protein
MTTMALIGGGFGFPLGFAGAATTTVVTIGAGAAEHHVYSLAALAVVLAAVSAVTSTPAAFGSAAVAWALHDGFVIGRQGQLVFTAEAARAAAVLGTIALTAVALGAAVRALRAVWADARDARTNALANRPGTCQAGF